MFDPNGLRDRYASLVRWNGLWCNYWTVTVPKVEDEGEKREEGDNLVPLETNMDGSSASVQSLTEADLAQEGESIGKDGEQKDSDKKDKENEKEKTKEKKKKKKPKSGRHFVVLPNGIGEFLGGVEKWEQVTIAGVDDEVAAHCGLFIRNQNLDYDGLVERVGKRIMRWCDEVKARS